MIAGGLLAITLAAYGSSLRNRFVNFDDDTYVFANAHVQHGLTLDNVRWAFLSTDCANWHPLTWLSLELDTTLFGTKPWGYHLTNLLLHGANTVLLFYVLRLMTGTLGGSAIVAAFFAVHPLHVESVAWISERKDVLCGLFFLLALWAWQRYVLQSSWRRYSLVAFTLALGLMAKPMLVTFPFVLLLLDWWPFARWRTSLGEDLRLLLEKLPLLALVLASCVVTYLVQREGGAVRSTEQLPLAERLINTPIAYLAYLRKTFWPFPLAVYYPHPEKVASLAEAIAGTTVLLAVSVLATLRARRWPYLFVGWFWWLGMLVPVVGLVQVGGQAYADRYMYLPMIGLLVVLVWSGHASMSWRRISTRVAPPLAAFALLVCAALSYRQVAFWHDGVSLWRHAVQTTAPNPVALNSLGVAILEQGKPAEAVEWLEQALVLSQEDERAHLNLALALVKLRRTNEAVDHYEAALRIEPMNPVANFNLALLLEADGDDKRAVEHYRRALAAEPGNWRAHLRIGTLLFRRGGAAAAEREFAEAVRLNPGLLNATGGRNVAD